eukprot:gene1300-1438_t
MNTSLHCSPNSAFCVPNIDNGYDLLQLDRVAQFNHDPIEPYFETQRDAQIIQPSPVCLDTYNSSFHQPVYHSLPAQNNISIPMVPFPLLHEFGFETGFIRKRNERERMRVRTVNEGYAHLREHLPLETSEKRMSKVETLRAAIKYIKYLEETLQESSPSEIGRKRKRTGEVIDGDEDDSKRNCIEVE